MKWFPLALIFLLAAMTAGAHPHMSMDARMEFIRNSRGVEGVRVYWRMDQYFSASIAGSYDKNKNGSLEPAEVKRVEAEAFSNLVNYGYFILIRTAKGRTSPKVVKDFTARLDKGTLIYQFTVPLDMKELGSPFWVAVFDLTYFCEVRYEKEAASLVGGPGPVVRLERVLNKDAPVYYNPYGAVDDPTLYPQWKPGLETAYPEEIMVTIP